MYIYTNHKGKNLHLPVPIDWNMDDVQYFLTGIETGEGANWDIPKFNPKFNPKSHLEIKETGEAKEAVEPVEAKANPEVKPRKALKPEALKSSPVNVPKIPPVEIVKPVESIPATVPVAFPTTANPAGDCIPCSEHPNYTGMRLGKTVKECPACLAIYNVRKSSGTKETRTRTKETQAH